MRSHTEVPDLVYISMRSLGISLFVRQVIPDPHEESHGGSGPDPPVQSLSQALLQDHPPQATHTDPHQDPDVRVFSLSPVLPRQGKHIYPAPDRNLEI